MKIVVATDSFKGTMKAPEACRIIADAIHEYLTEAQIVIKPMADGGEGTARAMIEAANGKWISSKVMGPLASMQVLAGFAWFEDKTALVEMASASGLELLDDNQMNPMKTTTYGTGELIRAAIEHGARKILLAVGGSATVDCGLGAAAALGWKFLDEKGNPVLFGGAGLEQVRTIIKPEKPDSVPVEVLCDVDNPLTGEHGAARIYGPQKGATPEMVEQLEGGLSNIAELVRQQLDCEIETLPGAGAAGGLAAGAVAFMSATIVSGIETVMARSNLRAELKSADWVITGEGSFDSQSLRGKVVSGVLQMARESGVKVAVLAGKVNIPQEESRRAGIEVALSCKTDEMSLDYALKNARKLLYERTKSFVEQHLGR